MGPRTPHAESTDALKYRAPGEPFLGACYRVAGGLADNDAHYRAQVDIYSHQRFLVGGRIRANIGSSKFTTPYNCFVSGTIADSYVDGPGNIMQRATEAAQTMRMGGGIGYDFSVLRPRGSLIGRLGSNSSGPVPFMRIYDGVCLATSSAGDRRGAQMGILRIDHPDIEEYIHAKQDNHTLRGFNLSVAVTDEFMEALLTGRAFALRWGGTTYREIDPAALWDTIMRGTWDWAEPGVIFIDTINRYNNLWYCETIAATNPCSEQPLPPFGACLLGSFNLPAYLLRGNDGVWSFSWDQLSADIPHVVRAMDNVVDVARYPLPEQQREALNKRRMGLGITGLANCVEALGFPYGSPEALAWQDELQRQLTHECYHASMMLAREKGAFPLWDQYAYDASRFLGTLDHELRADIRASGIRNSHLISIAPTGTISLTADNVSSSIEPVFSYRTERPIGGMGNVVLEDYGHKFLGVDGRLAADVSASDHLNVLLTAQRHVDSAVSKTVNMDGNLMPWDNFKDLYRLAWEGGAKGLSTFNISGRRTALLTSAEDDTTLSCDIGPDGRRSCE